MSKKKRHTSPPRFHRMKRAARLSNAQAWLPKYDGKNVVRGYRKRYGVDLLCAIAELQMLNVHLDPIYIERVHTTVKNQIVRKATKKKATSPDAMLEADTVFVYIAPLHNAVRSFHQFTNAGPFVPVNHTAKAGKCC